MKASKQTNGGFEMREELLHGDCIEEMPKLDSESIHAVVTDPPYNFEKAPIYYESDWDDQGDSIGFQEFSEDWAREAKRLLKPGGHLLSFCSTKQYHRMACGIEDAGFEIRDTLQWHYGSGFPVGLTADIELDKDNGVDRRTGEVEGRDIRMGNMVGGGKGITQTVDERREDGTGVVNDGEPVTEEAKKWEDWHTTLKPATELIVLARKPFDMRTIDCVRKHGTSVLNIGPARGGDPYEDTNEDRDGHSAGRGRYPTNLLLDNVAAGILDSEADDVEAATGYREGGRPEKLPSRLFYCPKPLNDERNMRGNIENEHETVKPVKVMQWLVRLVTREGQTVLDPFAGSGTTGIACETLSDVEGSEGSRGYVLIEKGEDSYDTAGERLEHTVNHGEADQW